MAPPAYTSLFRAAQRGDLDGVKRHLEAEQVHSQRIIRRALCVAVRNEEAAVVLLLWPVCALSMSYGVAYAAKFAGSRAVSTLVNMLLASHSDYVWQPALDYALRDACYYGNKVTVQCLLRAKVRVDGRPSGTPLYNAVISGNARVVLCLVQSKASLTAPINHQTLPQVVQHASYKGNYQHKSVVRILERALQHHHF
jgi:hypothetical protein